jgi:putative hemolysin
LETDSIPPSTLLWDINFYQVEPFHLVGFAALLLLLFFSALISGSEVAFFSLSPTDRSRISESKKKVYQLIHELLDQPEKLLATILVANNFINVGIVILSTYMVNNLVDFTNDPIVGFIIKVVIITFIILLFGEILPKIYASSFTLPFAIFMARPLKILSVLFSPVIYILIKSTSVVNRRMNRFNKKLSIDELSQAFELTDDQEFEEDKGILEGIINFGSISVAQIMTPRIDVVAVDEQFSYHKVIDIVKESGYSRIPVFNENFDHISGVLYVKDLLPHLDKPDTFNWQDLQRPPYYIPENKKIDDLLKDFQKNKVHMAIVVDEYGGTSGIVTLEDILEEIVGDIIDEFDDEDRPFVMINENTYLFDGKTQLNDFYRICDIDSGAFERVKGDADTLAGLLLEMKGDFPLLNEKISYQSIDFTVEDLDKRRIKKIKIVFNLDEPGIH